MMNEEQVRKELIKSLEEQVERLKKNDRLSIMEYKVVRQEIPVLERILELNSF